MKAQAIAMALVLVFQLTARDADMPAPVCPRAPLSLNTWTVTETPNVQRAMLASLYRKSGAIWVADNDRYRKLLFNHGSPAFLLPSGRYLVDQVAAGDDLALLRAVTLEDFCTLVKIEKTAHSVRYSEVRAKIMADARLLDAYRKLPGSLPASASVEGIFDDVIARAFQLRLLVEKDIVYRGEELIAEERDFLGAVRPMLEAKDAQGNYVNFSPAFFETPSRLRTLQDLLEKMALEGPSVEPDTREGPYAVEIKTAEGQETVLFLPLALSEAGERSAVAVNLSWIRDYHYQVFRKRSLDEWRKKYPEAAGVKCRKDLEDLAIWPVVPYDGSPADIIKWVARGGVDTPDGGTDIKKVSLSDMRKGLVFQEGTRTEWMKYPEVVALIDGVDFHFPAVRHIGDFQAFLDEGKPLKMDPDWFRTFAGLPSAWHGVACPNCGGADLEARMVIGPSRHVICASCGLEIDNPAADVKPDDLDRYATGKKLFAGSSKNMERARNVAADIMKVLREKYPEMINKPILDVGCSSGEVLKVLRDEYGWPRENLCGVEPSHYAVEFAREEYGLENIFEGTLETTALHGKKFAAVFIIQTIEHIGKPREVLAGARKVLVDGGLLAITGVPNSDGLLSLYDPVKFVAKNYPDGQHVIHFSAETLADMVERSGFDIVQQRGTDRDLVYGNNAGCALWLNWVYGVEVDETTADMKAVLARLKRVFTEFKKKLDAEKGLPYTFEIREGDFDTPEAIAAFYTRESWKSPHLGDLIEVWARKSEGPAGEDGSDRLKAASGELDELAKGSELANPASKMKAAARRGAEASKLHFCVPAGVLKRAPDITVFLRSLSNMEGAVPFKLVVTGVRPEDRTMISALGRDDIKKVLGLGEAMSVKVITESEIRERAALLGEDAGKAEVRACIVKDLYLEGLGTQELPDTELMAIATDAVADRETGPVGKKLEKELQKNISMLVLASPDPRESMFSLSAMVSNWLENVRNGKKSAIEIILPAIVSPAEMIKKLDEATRAVWRALIAA